MEFACDKCGTFLDSVDGAPVVCRCNGAFHFPPVAVKDEAEPEPEPLFPDSPPKDPEESSGDAVTSATFSPMPKMADETEKPKRRRSSRRK